MNLKQIVNIRKNFFIPTEKKFCVSEKLSDQFKLFPDYFSNYFSNFKFIHLPKLLITA